MKSTALKVGLALTIALTGAVGYVAGQARSRGPETGPVIADYGPVFDVPKPGFETPLDRVYKVVFDVASAPSDSDRLNPSIVTVARFLNMHARAGVAPKSLDASLVLHGNAGRYALDHAGYRKRYSSDNPSLDLLSQLRKAGVRVILCGQTKASRGFEDSELASSVEVALSAMTALVTLQQDGYQLIAF